MSLISLDKYDLIFFDCDGVIFDTNQSKVSIFLNSVDCNNREKDLFESFVKKNFGRSREFMFSYFLKEIMHEDFTNIKPLLIKYSKECIKMYQKKSYTEGFENLIQKYINKTKIILSGNNQDELHEVFKRRKIFKYFDQILGSPLSKEMHLKKFENKFLKMILIGDSYYDFAVAKQFNMDFIFVSKYSMESNLKIFKNKIYTLEELL